MARNAKHIVHEIYSDVMFELAYEAGLIDQVTDDLEAVGGILQDEPEFLSLLTLSEVKPEEKAQIVRRVFKDRINGLTLDFLCVLAKRNRMNFLHGIGQRYQTLSDEHKHLHRIEVTLAKEPDDAELEKLRISGVQSMPKSNCR
jgi:F-type H+-transporting ATPase subunit delta